MPLAARSHIDLALPRLQNRHRQTRRTAETEKPHALAFIHIRHPQAPKPDNPRAEQRRDLHVVQARRQRHRKIRSHRRIFRVPAAHRVARKRRPVAQIFHAMRTEPAMSVDPAHPRNADAGPQRQLRRRASNHFAHNLVPRNQISFQRRQIAFHNMQIRPANAARRNAQHQLPRPSHRPRHLPHLHVLARRTPRHKHRSLHSVPPAKISRDTLLRIKPPANWMHRLTESSPAFPGAALFAFLFRQRVRVSIPPRHNLSSPTQFAPPPRHALSVPSIFFSVSSHRRKAKFIFLTSRSNSSISPAPRATTALNPASPRSARRHFAPTRPKSETPPAPSLSLPKSATDSHRYG